MEIKIGKKTYKSGVINFLTFQKGTELAMRIESEDLQKDGFLTKEGFDLTKEIIVLYFGKQFKAEDLDEGLELTDGIDYMQLVYKVINNIQTNEGRREEIDKLVAEGNEKK